MSIPIIMLPKDESIQGYEKKYNPKETIYYVLSSDGLFLRKRNALYDCVHEAKAPASLGGAKEGLNLRCKPVPRDLLDEIIAFLAEVCIKHNAEGVVMLYYNPARELWSYLIPEQETVGGGLSVDYEMPATPDGYTLFGSVHSHARASAFQSGTDHKDECHFEGIHITVGKLPDNPELHVRFHACGAQWEFKDKGELIEPLVRKYTVPEGAMDKVKVKTYTHAGYKGSATTSTQQTSLWDNGDEKGFRQDGSVWCRDQQKTVAPCDSKRDAYPLGKVLMHKGTRYVKTATGWIEMGDTDEKKHPPSTEDNGTRSSSGKTPTAISPTEVTDDEDGLIERYDHDEILDVRDNFFGTEFGEVRLFAGMKYVRGVWGWEDEWEEKSGYTCMTLAARKEYYERMDAEEQGELINGYRGEHLFELLSAGWSPQDCLMALRLEARELEKTEEKLGCGLDS